MEKVNKKEIRVTYYLDNEEDKKVYEELKKHRQPGKVIKDIVYESLNTSNDNAKQTDVSLETLKLLDKLTDKIDNLKVSTVAVGFPEIEEEVIEEITLDAEVNADDIDIDF